MSGTGISVPGPGRDRKTVAVIGGGPAGMTAAITAAEAGADVTLFERNGPGCTGRKLGITGKGRCNLTNLCGRDVFLENVVTNPKFLYSAFNSFPPADVMAWFERMGVPLKTERGRRVFPQSDRASDIVAALRERLSEVGVKTVGGKVTSLTAVDGAYCLTAGGRDGIFDAAVLATGGLSYQMTGSDGSGYRLAAALGHTLSEPRAALVPIVSPWAGCARMQGLTLKNVSMSVRENSTGKTVFEDFGELLFTHFGISGPMALTASSKLREVVPGRYTACIDLKPALDRRMLERRVLSDFSSELNRDFSNSLDGLLPRKMIPVFTELTGIDPGKKVNSVTKEERERITGLLKCFEIPLDRLRPIDEAIVTSGGIPVSEIRPATMESKLSPGLYFAGEIIDTDALTGGYNLQIAWCTGHLAGLSAASV
ncbi:MAG: NAD(P)/FAD-dependent oxidoreductase [Clostridia bacterium]|nr:NAD(P)/FAD-dependent oxidoreductase [Clostridia bacterium]